MAGFRKLWSSFTFLVFLLVVCERESRYLKDMDPIHMWNGADVIHVGHEMCKIEIICPSLMKRQSYQASRTLSIS